MKAIWRRFPITVKDVQTAIHDSRSLAYTTVMTIMHRLYLKGFLRRSLHSRTHFYEPAVEFADVRDAAVNGMIDHFFQGSRQNFMEFMNGTAGESHLEEIREISSPTSLDETLL
jgi:predicted transcriptional regulator